MYHTIHEHIFYHTHIVSYNSWALTIRQYDIELFLHTIRYVSYDTDNYGLGWIVLSWISTSKGEREREREREKERENEQMMPIFVMIYEQGWVSRNMINQL